ncbi:MAG: hypothetical protein ABWW70_03640 [Thermoproteota archaeon]
MAGFECFDSGWCDYSRGHRRLRLELEKLVRVHAGLEEGELRLPVIVAPYGSGKTTLLGHLEWYARRLGLKAARVELVELVKYLEGMGKLHEAELPRAVESFVDEKLDPGDSKAVLLVDEVEESYDRLKELVVYETSPLRGLADHIRSGKARTMVVLAFGPVSAVKEAVFGPTAWRSRVYAIPPMSRSAVEEMVRRKLGGDSDRELVELLSNFVWWAGKGRPAWAALIVEEVLPRVAEGLRESPRIIHEVLSTSPSLRREVTSSTPLLDLAGYLELARKLGAEQAALLTVLVGPVPLSLLERLGADTGRLVGSDAVGLARTGARVEELVSSAGEVLYRVASIRGYPTAAVEYAVDVLHSVLSSMSLGGLVPYDASFLGEAVQLALDVARELYTSEPAVYTLLSTLSSGMLAAKPVELEEAHAYVKPRALAKVYPPLSSTPLLSCLQEKGILDEISRGEWLETLDGRQLIELGSQLASLLGAEEYVEKIGAVLAVEHGSSLDGLAEKMYCALDEPRRILVLSRASRERLGPVGDRMRRLGLLQLVELDEASHLFARSLAYLALVGATKCLEDMDARDARIFRIYGNAVKSAIIDAAARMGQTTLDRTLQKLHRMYGRYGEREVKALARALLSGRLGEGVVRNFVEKAANLYSVATRLGAGGEAIPDGQKLLRMLDDVRALASSQELRELIELAEELRRCSGASNPLDVLLGSSDGGELELAEELERVSESLQESLAQLPRTELLRRIEELASGVKAFVREARESGAAELVFLLERLAKLLVRVEGILKRLADQKSELAYMASHLPEELVNLLEVSVEEDLSRARALEELEDYVEVLKHAITRLRPAASELRSYTETAATIAQRIDRILSASRRGSPGSSHVEAGVS